MGVILLVAFPLNCLRVLWLAAYTAAVPGLVGQSQVGRATSILEAFYNLGFIAGPGIAGVLAAVIGPGPTIAVRRRLVRDLGIGRSCSSGDP